MCITNRRPSYVNVPPAAFGLLREELAEVPSMLERGLTEKVGVPGSNSGIIMTHHNYSRPDEKESESGLHYDGDDDRAASRQEHHERMKKLLPGLTAKNHIRHYAQHNYRDHSRDIPNGWEERQLDEEEDGKSCIGPTPFDGDHARKCVPKGGVPVPFPLKLHEMLDKIEEDGLASVVSWQPHGRAFVVHDTKAFVSEVMPKYFRQTKMTSFQRQLNLYGFSRITRGRDKGGYYHELFLRGMKFLSHRMTRTKVKGTKIKAVSSPELEPNFYVMPAVRPKQKATSPDFSSLPPSLKSMEFPRAYADTCKMHYSTTNTKPCPVSVLPDGSYSSPALIPERCSSHPCRLGAMATVVPSQVSTMSSIPSPAPTLQVRCGTQNNENATRQEQQLQDLLLSFEGMPFHYLDPTGAPSVTMPAASGKAGNSTQEVERDDTQRYKDASILAKDEVGGVRSSAVVSDSSDCGTSPDEDLLAVAAAASCEKDENMEEFFANFDMPVVDVSNIDSDAELGLLLEQLVE